MREDAAAQPTCQKASQMEEAYALRIEAVVQAFLQSREPPLPGARWRLLRVEDPPTFVAVILPAAGRGRLIALFPIQSQVLDLPAVQQEQLMQYKLANAWRTYQRMQD